MDMGQSESRSVVIRQFKTVHVSFKVVGWDSYLQDVERDKVEDGFASGDYSTEDIVDLAEEIGFLYIWLIQVHLSMMEDFPNPFYMIFFIRWIVTNHPTTVRYD